MQDEVVSKSRILMMALWCLVGALMAVAWGIAMFGWWGQAQLVGLTACAVSAGAATAHIRCFALRLSAIIKANGRDPYSGDSSGDALRSVR